MPPAQPSQGKTQNQGEFAVAHAHPTGQTEHQVERTENDRGEHGSDQGPVVRADDHGRGR